MAWDDTLYTYATCPWILDKKNANQSAAVRAGSTSRFLSKTTNTLSRHSPILTEAAADYLYDSCRETITVAPGSAPTSRDIEESRNDAGGWTVSITEVSEGYWSVVRAVES